ncbi:hypothetical protein ACV344_34975, partial [Pseudomonas aeruginosa]
RGGCPRAATGGSIPGRRDPLTRLDQRWAQPMRGLRLSSAELPFNGQLEDEQGKFNLRNLLVDQRPDLQE